MREEVIKSVSDECMLVLLLIVWYCYSGLVTIRDIRYNDVNSASSFCHFNLIVAYRVLTRCQSALAKLRNN